MPTAVRRIPPVSSGLLPDLRRVATSLGLALVILLFVVVAVRVLGSAYAERALPGLSVGGVPVGSLEAVALRERLMVVVARWHSTAVEIQIDDRALLASDESLGLAPDLDAAVNTALAYGKEGPLAVRAAAWMRALVGVAELPLPLRASGDRLTLWVEAIATAGERPVGEGTLLIDGATVRATPPEVGRYVDRVALRFEAAVGDRRITLPVRVVHPALDPVTFEASVALARAAILPLDISAGGQTLRVHPSILGSLVTVRREPFAASSARSSSEGTFVPTVRTRFALAVDDAELQSAVGVLAARLDRAPRDAGYAVRANGSLAVTPGADGAAADRTALAAALRHAIVDPGAPRTITLPATLLPPQFGTQEAIRDAALLTRVGFAELYHAPDARPAAAPPDILLPPGAAIAGDALPASVAEALFAAAIGAGYATDGASPGWRNDSAHALFARPSITLTSIAWELWSIPTGRQVVFGPAEGGNLLRRVSAPDGVVLSTVLIPARLGPPRAPEGAGQTIPITGVNPGR